MSVPNNNIDPDVNVVPNENPGANVDVNIEVNNNDHAGNVPPPLNPAAVGNPIPDAPAPMMGQQGVYVLFNEDGTMAQDQQPALAAQAAANATNAAIVAQVAGIPPPAANRPPVVPQPGDPLLERKLRLLRPKLEAALILDIELAPGEDINEVLYELVEGYLLQARTKIPIYEEIMGRLRAVADSAAKVRDEIANNLRRAPIDKENCLNRANEEVKDWCTRLVPLLDKIFLELPKAWYMPKTKDPALERVENLRREMTAIAQKVRQARKDAGLSGNEAQTKSSEPLQLKAPKKDAREVKAATFVTTFTGEGSPVDAIPLYQNWKRQFLKLQRHLEEKCEDADSDVQLQQLWSTLKGPAAKLVSTIRMDDPKGVEKAITLMDDRYGDAVSVVTSYLNDCGKPIRGEPIDRIKAMNDNLDQMELMEKAVEKEKLRPFEFVTLTNIISALSPAAAAAWRAKVMQLEDEHKAENKDKKEEDKVPWTKSLALNRTRFENWYKAYVTCNPKDEEPESEAEASNFLAGSIKPVPQKNQGKDEKCLLHPEAGSHPTATCKKLQHVETSEFRQLCYNAGKCYSCLDDFQPGHRCRTSCLKCGGRHLTERCGKDFPSLSTAPTGSFKPRGGFQQSRGRGRGRGGYGNRGRSDHGRSHNHGGNPAANSNMMAEFRDMKSSYDVFTKALSNNAAGKGGRKKKPRSRSADSAATSAKKAKTEKKI